MPPASSSSPLRACGWTPSSLRSPHLRHHFHPRTVLVLALVLVSLQQLRDGEQVVTTPLKGHRERVMSAAVRPPRLEVQERRLVNTAEMRFSRVFCDFSHVPMWTLDTLRYTLQLSESKAELGINAVVAMSLPWLVPRQSFKM